MAVPLLKYTYEDYKHWRGDWELIDGFPVAMAPSPKINHQYLTAMFATLFNLSLHKNNCEECMVVVEEDYIVNEETVLRPDVAVICNEDNDFITKAPEIVVEVISHSTARIDENEKFKIYEKEGVKFYILAYPDFKVAKVYENRDGFKKIGDFSNEKINLNAKCKIEIDFDTIFKKLRRQK
jgi:Uma2 family endonuclease